MSDRPNILFILSDQHNAKCMGVSGHPIVKTPNLDRLASEGVNFTNAITQNPICTPARVSFFSGQYPHNHGFFGNEGEAPAALPTILGHFHAQGYGTAAVGKVHCPHGWIEADCDHYRGACAATENAPGTEKSDYDRYLEERGLLDLRDDDMYPEQTTRTWRSKDGRPSSLDYRDSVEGWCVSETQKIIEGFGKQPWFIQVGFPRPHQIYSPSAAFWEMYPDDLPMPPNADMDMGLKSPHMREKRKQEEEQSPLIDCFFGQKGDYEGLRRRKLRGYFGMITQTDHAVGELLQALKDRGLEEGTIVVYASDHGEYACQFGLLEKVPGICSNAVTRVPYIWRWPGHFKAGHGSKNLVESCVDFSATASVAAGLPEFSTGDGKDITPLLEGQDVQLRRVAVTENAWSKSVVKGKWRFVYYPLEMFAQEDAGKRVGDLYDLEEDPWEMNNLFYDPAHQDKVAEMREELLNWLVNTTRVVTTTPATPSRVAGLTHRRDGDGKVSAECLRSICQLGQTAYL